MTIFTPLATERDRSIDGMRGILSSGVALSHLTGEFGGPLFVGGLSNLVLSIAVSMFAALSGYVLCVSLLRHPINADAIKGFYIRRFFRLWPVYAVYFIITFVAIVSIIGLPSARTTITLLSDLFMLDLLRFGWLLHSATWSLYPEVIFSAILPIWYLFIRKARSFPAAVAAYVIIAVFQWAATPSGPSHITFVFLRFFFLGIALFHMCEIIRSHYAALRWFVYAGFVVGFVLLVGFIHPFFLEEFFAKYRSVVTSSYHQDAMITLLVPPIICCAPLRWLFSLRPLVFLGAISYGVYILHMPLMMLLNGNSFDMQTGIIAQKNMSPGYFGVWTSVVYWMLTIILATAVHVAIERPGIEYGRKLSRRKP